MSVTLYMTKGLPGSGKTTWAKDFILARDKNTVKRVNKDDLRDMLDVGRWSKGNEKFVLNVRDGIVLGALQDGKHVIVDDTNLAPKHEARLRQLAKGAGADFKVIDFTEVTPEECIKRDLKRARSVGSDVIMRMYNQFLKPEPPVYTPPENGYPFKAIIVDIDGTIARMTSRGPYDWDRVGEDEPVQTIIDLVRQLSRGRLVILMSGRDGSCRDETEKWLAEHGVTWDFLFMREAGDMRKDSLVKREIFEERIRDSYHVEFVLDDRDQVVDMWRNELGLTCLQVAEGNF